MPSSIALLAISGADATVVITSITLVFAMLVALCLVITGEGRLFDQISAQKKRKQQQEWDAAMQNRLPAPPDPAPAPAAAPAAPAADGGIPAEVVAAIAAAVYTLEGEGAVVHSIRRLPAAPGSRRGVWGNAGVVQNVRPF